MPRPTIRFFFFESLKLFRDRLNIISNVFGHGVHKRLRFGGHGKGVQIVSNIRHAITPKI